MADNAKRMATLCRECIQFAEEHDDLFSLEINPQDLNDLCEIHLKMVRKKLGYDCCWVPKTKTLNVYDIVNEKLLKVAFVLNSKRPRWIPKITFIQENNPCRQ